MANIILLFALVYFGQKVYCNDAILSKFHQHGYKLKDVRGQLMSYNKAQLNLIQLKAFKFNRTTTAHNFTVNFKNDVRDQIEVLVQVHKFLSNEYRHFPIRFQVNLQKSWKANIMGLSYASKCGNITSFNFRKNITYHLCNFVHDEAHFPPLMPNGIYRVDMTCLYTNIELALIYLYAEVYTPMKYP